MTTTQDVDEGGKLKIIGTHAMPFKFFSFIVRKLVDFYRKPIVVFLSK